MKQAVEKTMNKLALAVQAIVGSALLFGCATQGGVQPQVKPFLAMRDGGVVASGYYELGQYYQAKDRRSDAITAYRRALALDNRMAEVHNALGAVLASANDFDGATAEFNAAIALDPSASHFRNNLGYALYLQGRAEEAVANFEIATALDPANARTWNNMSLALAELGNAKASSVALANANDVAARKSEGPAALPAPDTRPLAMSAPAETLPDRGPSALPARVAAPALPGHDAWAEPIAVRDLLRPVDASPIAVLRPFDSAELIADQNLATSLANAVLVPDPLRTLDSIDPNSAALAALEWPPAGAWTLVPQPQLGSRNGDQALQVRVGSTSAPEGAAVDQPGFEPAQPIACTMVASLDPPNEALLRIDVEAIGVPFVGLPVPPGDAIAPPFDRDAGTLISEVPSDPTIVEIAPHALELKWKGTAVIIRPASPAARTEPIQFGIEVSNGNGVTGMAARIGGLLQDIGLPRSRLTNQKPFTQLLTEIQYRDGHEAAAAALSARFPNNPRIARNDRLRADVDVRVVLGRDLPRAVALIDAAPDGARSTGIAAASGGRSAGDRRARPVFHDTVGSAERFESQSTE